MKKLLKCIVTRPLLLLIFGTFGTANATPLSFTYQGRIVNANGTPLEYQSVSFEFTITNPDGSCVLYREQKDGVDMRNSKGVFDTPIGAGTKQYPAAPTFTLLSAFANSGTLNCEGGGTYSPSVDDTRKLRVQFFDGSGWRLISPDNVIRSVPYAGYAANATSATKLGTNVVADFQLKNDIPVCTGSDVLTSSSVGVLSCVASGGSSTPTGAASGDLTGTYPGPTIAANAVTTAKIADGNVTAAKLETVAGLSAGTYGSATAIPAVTVDTKGRVTAISTNSISGLLPSAGGASGKFLKSDGTSWAGADVKFSDIKNSVGATAFNTGACAANQTVKWSSLTDMFECQNIGSLDAAAITTGTIDAARLPAGASMWQSGASGAIYYAGGSVGIGTSTPIAPLNVHATAGTNTQIKLSDDDVAHPMTGVTQTTAFGRFLSINGGRGGLAIDGYNDDGTDIGLALSGFLGSNTPTATVAAVQLKGFKYDGGTGGTALGATETVLQIANSSTRLLTALGSGNIGIGTTTPTRKLEVSGSAAAAGITEAVVNTATSGYSSIELATDSSWGGVLNYGSTYTAAALRNDTAFVSKNDLYVMTNTDVQNGGSGAINFMTGGWDTATQMRMTITSTGNVGVGTSSAPTSKLEVNGAIRNTAAISNGSSTVDFATGNIQYTTADCGSFALHNLKDGGSYTFIVQGTNSALCAFTAFSDAGSTALTVHLPQGHGATTAGEHTFYSIVVAGTHAYFSWVTAFD